MSNTSVTILHIDISAESDNIIHKNQSNSIEITNPLTKLIIHNQSSQMIQNNQNTNYKNHLNDATDIDNNNNIDNANNDDNTDTDDNTSDFDLFAPIKMVSFKQLIDMTERFRNLSRSTSPITNYSEYEEFEEFKTYELSLTWCNIDWYKKLHNSMFNIKRSGPAICWRYA